MHIMPGGLSERGNLVPLRRPACPAMVGARDFLAAHHLSWRRPPHANEPVRKAWTLAIFVGVVFAFLTRPPYVSAQPPPIPAPEAWAARGDPTGPTAVAFRPDNRVVGIVDDDSGAVLVWDVMHKRKLGRLRSRAGPIRALAFSADGKLLATGGDDSGDVDLWDGASLRRLKGFRIPVAGINGLAFAPAGKRLISTSRDGTIGFAEVPPSNRVTLHNLHRGPVAALAIAPSGRVLATSTGDGDVQLWDLITMALRRQIALPGPRVPNAGPNGSIPFPPLEPAFLNKNAVAIAMRFSPDSKYLCCSAGREIFVYEVAGSKLARRFSPGHAMVKAVAYGKSGHILGAAGVDGNISIWAMPSGKMLGHFRANRGPIFALSVDAPHDVLFSIGRRQGVGQWSLKQWERNSGDSRGMIRGHRSFPTSEVEKRAGSGRRLPGRPSRRSVRAQLRHTARHGTGSLRTAHRVDDQRARQRVTLAQRVEGVPGEAARPRAARQPLLPGALHGVPEAAQRFAVARNSVVRTMPTQLLTQRLMLLRNR